MALVNVKDLLEYACVNRYALGAFEIMNLDFLCAIIDAAEQVRSPVILNLREPYPGALDLELLVPAVVQAARRAQVPVAVHMDYCHNLESVQTAIRLGCNSVMYDNVSIHAAENIENTRRIVNLAHSCGIPVEGGLGVVAASEEAGSAADQSMRKIAEQVRYYIEQSGIDFLSVTIDSVLDQAGDLETDDGSVFARIKQGVNMPLVTHGIHSLNEAHYQALIDKGVAKINYDMDVMVSHVNHKLPKEDAGYFKMSSCLRESISVMAKNIFDLSRSSGRAQGALAQCESWHNIEHVIVYNTSENDPAVILNMMVTGKQQLSSIPGVLDVKIGRTTEAKGKYRYCWLIRFAHENVIESYKNHPIHVAYADTYFRPIAADRVSNNYEIFDDLQAGGSLRL